MTYVIGADEVVAHVIPRATQRTHDDDVGGLGAVGGGVAAPLTTRNGGARCASAAGGPLPLGPTQPPAFRGSARPAQDCSAS